MTSNLNSSNSSPRGIPAANSCPDQAPDATTHLKRDRFELLSAYLDGEISADERRQVEEWLTTDPAVQSLYTRLLKLRRGMRTAPVPTACPVEQTVERVMSRLERRPKRTLAWGGMAIAALFVSAVFGLSEQSILQPVAQSGATHNAISTDAPSSNSLMIALDRPAIEIPKAPVSDAASSEATYPSTGVQ